MKGPICDACTKSGILCDDCSRKLGNKEVSELDIRVARLLNKLEERDMVRGATFERAFEVDNLIVITTRGRVGALVGKQGRVVRLLSKELDRKVRVVGTLDLKMALNDLVAPARIQGMNIVYRPEGDQTKAIVAKEDKFKLIAGITTLEKAANLLSDKTIVFEMR